MSAADYTNLNWPDSQAHNSTTAGKLKTEGHYQIADRAEKRGTLDFTYRWGMCNGRVMMSDWEKCPSSRANTLLI